MKAGGYGGNLDDLSRPYFNQGLRDMEKAIKTDFLAVVEELHLTLGVVYRSDVP